MFLLLRQYPVCPFKQIAIFARWLFAVVLAFVFVASHAATVDVSELVDGKMEALGFHADVFTEEQTRLELDSVRMLYREGRFVPGTLLVLSFGIGSPPVWVRLALFNAGTTPKNIYANLGTTWIDQLDAYLLSPDGPTLTWRSGDSLPGAIGVLPGIGSGLMLSLPPGPSELYVRAQTPDPLLLPIAFFSEHKLASAQRQVHYAYGALYGFLLALIIYNCMLYFGLRQRSHLYYALYVLCFIVMNMNYTGHGLAYMWPDRPDFQRFVIVVSILLYAASGLLFANSFLELAKYSVRLHRWVNGFVVFGVLAMLVCIALDNQLAAVLLAFCYLSTVTAMMVALGVFAVLTRQGAGIYFLAGTLLGMLGAAATTTSVWGAIPYNTWTYHGIEFGIVLEATLLALALARQVSYAQYARQRAEHLAQRDPLTGLYNRRAFFDLSRGIWSQSQRRARPLSVLILDIDHFKQINDRYGHEGGDRLLTSVSHLLTATCRTGDVLARWGGEEFVILLPETDLEQARLFAERVRQFIDETGHVSGQDTIRCTASIGVAVYCDDVSLDALIARADAHLYEAKAGGRNQVCG
nr:diguanylate cyclase [uncultured Rhodoferax sp.]